MQLEQIPVFIRVIAGCTFGTIILVYIFWQRPSVYEHSPTFVRSPSTSAQACSPADWSAGAWVKKSNPKQVEKPEDVYEASGFLGCASNREIAWHFSNDHPDELPWRGHVSQYEWTPAGKYSVPNDREVMVIDLVENGGWLLIGDSVTEEHFFSISCTLYPHVIATPNYTGRWDWDRAWPQNLYLNPSSPLLSKIRMPEGFDVEKTPLVTFRRVDLLYNHTEIDALHYGGQIPENQTIFGDEQSWDMSPKDYFSIFLSPLPTANYRTMIVSTGGHWSVKLFAGLRDGLPGIHNLFRAVVSNWVYEAGLYVDAAAAQNDTRRRELVVRPYLPGDDACHTKEVLWGEPLTKPRDLTGASYNWEWIPRLNLLFKEAVGQRDHPNIHYVDIERPGRLRPDAHALSDCLHLAVGAGVIEGWTQYIHYYTSAYLPLLRRGQRFSLSRLSTWFKAEG